MRDSVSRPRNMKWSIFALLYLQKTLSDGKNYVLCTCIKIWCLKKILEIITPFQLILLLIKFPWFNSHHVEINVYILVHSDWYNPSKFKYHCTQNKMARLYKKLEYGKTGNELDKWWIDQSLCIAVHCKRQKKKNLENNQLGQYILYIL